MGRIAFKGEAGKLNQTGLNELIPTPYYLTLQDILVQGFNLGLVTRFPSLPIPSPCDYKQRSIHLADNLTLGPVSIRVLFEDRSRDSHISYDLPFELHGVLTPLCQSCLLAGLAGRTAEPTLVAGLTRWRTSDGAGTGVEKSLCQYRNIVNISYRAHHEHFLIFLR